ncbi:hypothetical protein VNO77_27508 [Canavalia gladiata]|uniref:Uncharacterized protein n=1 Tax=Canavalia gladiata TaxID=3824 RepID=A0AAN9QAK4_CANGL
MLNVCFGLEGNGQILEPCEGCSSKSESSMCAEPRNILGTGAIPSNLVPQQPHHQCSCLGIWVLDLHCLGIRMTARKKAILDFTTTSNAQPSTIITEATAVSSARSKVTTLYDSFQKLRSFCILYKDGIQFEVSGRDIGAFVIHSCAALARYWNEQH